MFAPKCSFFSRTVFVCMRSVLSSNVTDKISVNDHSSFNSETCSLALKHQLGTPQHKKTVLSHLFNHQYNIRQAYNLSKFKNKINTQETCGPSSNVLTELPIMENYLDVWDFEVKSVEILSDVIQTPLEGQKQPNMDYSVDLYQHDDHNHVLDPITRYHDAKDGKHMFVHSTRGSLGLLTFDEKLKNIQTMSEDVTSDRLIAFNKNRLNSLRQYLERPDLCKFKLYCEPYIKACEDELEQCKRGKSIFDVNPIIENILWNGIQRHHMFPRSISFIFLQKIKFDDQLAIGDSSAESYYRFQYEFGTSFKEDKLYSLDNFAARREFYHILLKTYKNVDPSMKDKFLYLQQNGIQLTKAFEEVLKNHG